MNDREIPNTRLEMLIWREAAEDVMDAVAQADAELRDVLYDFTRYGGGPLYTKLTDALRAIATVNEDIWHSRSIQLIEEGINKSKLLLDQLLEEVKADQ